MHRIAVDITFTKMTTKSGIKMHSEQIIAAMYKEYTQIYYMKVMKALIPERLGKSQKRGHYAQ